MTQAPIDKQIPEPLQRQIRKAADAVDPNHWYPAQSGIVPQFRIGDRWFSILWLIPVVFAGAVAVFGIAWEIYGLPIVQSFIAKYPGFVATKTTYQGFPLWLRLQHFFNLFLLLFIMRSGIQILADHPRLYLDNNCTPGREWFRFQKAVPMDRLWTARDDAVTLPGWFGIPGLRHSIGLARWWHFSCNLFWLLNGAIFYGLLFSTDQWQRLVPTSLDVFPNALSCMIQYASFHMPPENGWVRYNSLQQLAYFTTVFIAPPLVILSGIMQSPAVSNRAGWFGKIFNRQVARTIHFGVLIWFIQFIAIHVTMVFVTGFRRNLNHIMIGTDTQAWTGTIITAGMLFVLAVLWFWATPFTLRHARLVQRIGTALVGPIMKGMEIWSPTTQFTEKDIAPFLWPNGKMPDSEEFNKLAEDDFADYKLVVNGLVNKPAEFSYAEIRAMAKQEQITNHFCIQGWTGVAKWGGLSMSKLMEQVQPQQDAKYVLFYSFGEGHDGGFYWDAHSIENMQHETSLLAYEMNGKPLGTLHGAPLRLRCENELGFKLVKWIRQIEFVSDYKHIGSGQGGYAEDNEFFAYSDPI
jgi:DMSO/TMAO reductase YedYZ molybdopterin-dependent catalytic subunit/thiosulfate reductase cytochrome b subunit